MRSEPRYLDCHEIIPSGTCGRNSDVWVRGEKCGRITILSGRQWVNLFLDLREVFLPGEAKVVFALEVEPELGIDTEIETQTKSGLGRNAALAADDQLERRLRDARILRDAIDGQVVWPDEFGQEDFSRRKNAYSLHT
jgi:hypothetical protein